MRVVLDAKRRRSHPARVLTLGLLLAGPLFLSLSGEAPTPGADAPPAVAATTATPRFVFDPSYAPLADALRRRACDAALRPLVPRAAGEGAEAANARLVLGLYAHACEQVGMAEQALSTATSPGGDLEDWRLLVLADSAAAQQHWTEADAALARLLTDYPQSPLHERALIRAAELAWQHGDATRALELVAAGRGEALPPATQTRLDLLAWEIGQRLGDRAILTEAARRLLVSSPLEASRLKVVELFRAANGEVDWASFLDPRDLERRAQALAGIDLLPSALSTLDAVPAAGRDLEWRLHKAELLVRDHRGREALALLEGADAAEPALSSRVEWTRALAAEDAATAWRGRQNLARDAREQMQLASHRHLRRVIELDGDRALSVAALRMLFTDLADDHFEGAMASLRALRLLDPSDDTGARYLWQRGWQQYRERNYSGAIGYWGELESLYPEESVARGGRYWTARAFEALGDSDRARTIYRQVATADTTDFYRKYALARLAGTPPPEPEATAAGTWPTDPRLERAALLVELGLDDLSLSEIAAVEEVANPRAVAALRGRILGLKGARRDSVQELRRAFPGLGGPHQAGVPDEALRLYYPIDFTDTVTSAASRFGIPAHLVFAMIRQESAFDLTATSHAGARGLMQLMPATGRELARKMGLDYSHQRLSDPRFNILLGTAYFRQVLAMFDDNLELALAGYNGGPYRIKRLWREADSSRGLDTFLEDLSIEESRSYVKRILILADSYRQLYPSLG